MVVVMIRIWAELFGRGVFGRAQPLYIRYFWDFTSRVTLGLGSQRVFLTLRDGRMMLWVVWGCLAWRDWAFPVVYGLEVQKCSAKDPLVLLKECSAKGWVCKIPVVESLRKEA